MSKKQKNPGIELPVFLSGRVVRSDFDVCMQKGVDHHLIHSTAHGIASIRIKAANSQVARIFQRAEGRRNDIVIAGYWHFGIEGPICNYISVFAAGPIEQVGSDLKSKMGKD